MIQACLNGARSKGEQLGFDAKTGLAERPDRLVGLLVPTFFGDVFGIPWLYEILCSLCEWGGLAKWRRLLVAGADA